MIRKRWSRRGVFGALLVVALLAGCSPASCCYFISPPDELSEETFPSAVSVAPIGSLLAGAAKVDITPDRPLYMAGYKINKPHTEVHSPITVRAIAVRRGDVTCVVVGSDLIGLHNYQIEAVRDRVADAVARDAVLICASHTHAGPDTLGMWGIPPIITGLDDDYTETVLAGLAKAIRQAVNALEPVVVRWGEGQVADEGVSKNARDPDLIDRGVTAVAFDRPDGTSVATLVHFACHPESLGSKNTILSADFPATLYSTVEEARPGVAVFLNGALGGMITTDEKNHSVEETERIGREVGSAALKGLEASKALPVGLDLACVRRKIMVPMQNRRLHLGNVFGIFGPRPFESGGFTPSEVMALRLGPMVLLTAPGEALPRFGFELEGLIAGEPALLVGLGGDELGYLIHEEDWDEERYSYERTVSPGPLTTTLLRQVAKEVLKEAGALRAEDQEPKSR